MNPRRTQSRNAAPRALCTLCAAVVLLATFGTTPALADPCGMVPPIYTGDGPPIVRVGLQKTYVFWRDGIETYVIRPGFSGKVDNFGMLIPFPTVPAMRKVDDNIFAHVAAAIDPPEVVIDLRPQPEMEFRFSAPGAPTNSAGLGVTKDDGGVEVLKEEAIGMYEVVVLAAGSAAALQKWMDDHGYQYPKGMDAACNDYIAIGWCFVAVKTRVSGKAAVDPRAGMEDTNPGIPEGGSFDGNVQAMGFRFPCEKLVVPMRLSSFNAGELHNIVYLLTDQPSAIDGMDAGMVRRQISGAELYRNVTAPLPLRVLGGTWDNIPEARRESLKAERDPAPHNSLARELFMLDLLAVKSGNLSHPHEEREKELLNIGERLDLRGPEIDALNRAELMKAKIADGEAALRMLDGMTMTVIDGDFDRELLAAQNLSFKSYTIAANLNTPETYHCGEVLMADAAPASPSPMAGFRGMRANSPRYIGDWWGNLDGADVHIYRDPVPKLANLAVAPTFNGGTAPTGPDGPSETLIIGIILGLGVGLLVVLGVMRRRANPASETPA